MSAKNFRFDQGSWGGVCNTGKRQSPVNAVTFGNDVQYIKRFNLSLINYSKPELNATITNLGHTVQIALDSTPRFVILDSSLYDCHFVHWNQRYATFEEAANKPDGLLVIAVIYRLAYRNNPKFDVVTNMVRAVQKPNTIHVSQQPLNLLDILPNLITNPQYNSNNYYGETVSEILNNIPYFRSVPVFTVYKGSLTTPPCSEVVTWIVFTQTQNLESKQKIVFNGVLRENHGKEEPIGNNYRKIQPLNNRVFTIAKDYTFNVK
ncbi:Carbonic anhydrase 2-like protein [Leptotrombidium deliense]|uniref:Carbonic anhydrase 2-like protein n=1 Tax=Leptotrombidium deliense TaxID=299467 RepID=A0A443S7K4_9ACAR|nr:Carbonic anhydrase 2-like protein [Leptotrombidium deliense]